MQKHIVDDGLKMSGEGDRLLFLLKHEFRLWDRSSESIRSLWTLLDLYAVLPLSLLFGGLTAWVLKTFQVPQIHFSADSPPDNILFYAGAIVYAALFCPLLGGFLKREQETIEKQTQNWLCSSPLTNRIMFASTVLSAILTTSITANVLGLIISIPLAIFYQSPRFWMGMHLTLTAWIAISISLSFWGLYLSLKWENNGFWKFIIKTNSFVLFGIYLLISGVLFGIGDRFFDSEKIIQIIAKQFERGHILYSDSWLWFPVRAVFLDPLSIAAWAIAGIGLTGLTIQTLHHPLSIAPHSTLSTQKQVTSATETPRQFQENIFYLLAFREWKRLMGQSIFWQVFLTLIIDILILNPSWTSLTSISWDLAALSVYIPAMNAAILAHSCFADDPIKDLLVCSPVNIKKLKFYKLLTVLISASIPLVPHIIAVGIFGKPWVLIAALGFATTISHTFLRAWNASASIPKSFPFLLGDGDLSLWGCRDEDLTLFEGLSFMFWGFIAGLLLIGQITLGLFCLGGEGFILFFAYRRNRLLGDSWSV
jgi:hypothetical protein